MKLLFVRLHAFRQKKVGGGGRGGADGRGEGGEEAGAALADAQVAMTLKVLFVPFLTLFLQGFTFCA